MRSPVGAAARAIRKGNRDVIAPHDVALSLAPARAASVCKDLRTLRASAGASGLAAYPSTAVPLVPLAAGSLSMPSICCTKSQVETLNAWRRGAERAGAAGTSGVFIALWSRQVRRHVPHNTAADRLRGRALQLLSKPVSFSLDDYKLSDPACPLRTDSLSSIGLWPAIASILCLLLTWAGCLYCRVPQGHVAPL